MKTLVIGQESIGDTLSNTLPIIRALKEQGHIVHFVGKNSNTHCLVENFPFVDQHFPIGSKPDVTSYDLVYACAGDDYQSLKAYENVVRFQANDSIFHRPQKQLDKLGLVFQERYLNIDLNWYQNYYRDFHCRENSVLLNCHAYGPSRSYSFGQKLIECLGIRGFDVRRFVLSEDIRTNLHLVEQAPYVLTVDTSTVWMAKALGKTPYVFMAEGVYSKELYVKRLQCENILPWKSNLDEFQPEELVNCFEKEIRIRKSKFL